MNKVVAKFKADIEVDMDKLMEDPYSTFDTREILKELERQFWEYTESSNLEGVALQNLDFIGLEVKECRCDDT